MILADTGFFVALGNRRDRYHASALRCLTTLSEPLITTYPVVTEVCYLLNARGSGASAQYDFLQDLADGAFQVFDLSSPHIHRIIELLRQYADLPMDFADASLVALAEHLREGRILTADQRDFSVYRWQSNAFENLLI